jgi:hypothetical protein
MTGEELEIKIADLYAPEGGDRKLLVEAFLERLRNLLDDGDVFTHAELGSFRLALLRTNGGERVGLLHAPDKEFADPDQVESLELPSYSSRRVDSVDRLFSLSLGKPVVSKTPGAKGWRSFRASSYDEAMERAKRAIADGEISYNAAFDDSEPTPTSEKDRLPWQYGSEWKGATGGGVEPETIGATARSISWDFGDVETAVAEGEKEFDYGQPAAARAEEESYDDFTEVETAKPEPPKRVEPQPAEPDVFEEPDEAEDEERDEASDVFDDLMAAAGEKDAPAKGEPKAEAPKPQPKKTDSLDDLQSMFDDMQSVEPSDADEKKDDSADLDMMTLDDFEAEDDGGGTAEITDSDLFGDDAGSSSDVFGGDDTFSGEDALQRDDAFGGDDDVDVFRDDSSTDDFPSGGFDATTSAIDTEVRDLSADDLFGSGSRFKADRALHASDFHAAYEIDDSEVTPAEERAALDMIDSVQFDSAGDGRITRGVERKRAEFDDEYEEYDDTEYVEEEEYDEDEYYAPRAWPKVLILSLFLLGASVALDWFGAPFPLSALDPTAGRVERLNSTPTIVEAETLSGYRYAPIYDENLGDVLPDRAAPDGNGSRSEATGDEGSSDDEGAANDDGETTNE